MIILYGWGNTDSSHPRGSGGGGWSAILKSGLLFLYIIINVQGPKQHRGVLQGHCLLYTRPMPSSLASQYVGVMLSCK